MLALVQWMSPQWLWALPLAVFVPLLAHLLSRRMGRLALFPTVRFVQKAMALQSRWYWPRHWLLLLLRMLILAMVIVALAQPIWWQKPDQASRNHQGLAVVLILDASASMQRSEQGSSLFEIARNQAIQALNTLDPLRDRAMVILLDAAPQPLLPRMSANFSAMVNELGTLNPTWENGDLSAALTMATRPSWDPDDLTATAPLEIHLYSDMQRSNWPGEAQLRSILVDKNLTLHHAGKAQGNLALHNAAITPAMPVLGQQAAVWVDVANYSDTTEHASPGPVDVNVVMTAQGKRQVRRVKLSPRGTSRVSFPWLPQQAGPAYVELALEVVDLSSGSGGSGGSGVASGSTNSGVVDAMAIDNHVGRFVQVARARHVALVSASDFDNPAAAAYYFKRALAPSTDPRINDVQLRLWTPAKVASELSSASPSTWPACVVMVETGDLSDDARSALTQYMQRGGGVWWVIDSPQAAASLAKWQTDDGAVSPALPVSPVLAQAGAQASLPRINRVDGVPHIGSGAYNETELLIFDGPSRSALQEPIFSSVYEGTLAPGATGLLYYAHLLPGDGGEHPPLLAYQAVGPGRLAVLTAVVAPAFSPLVKGPVFVPLVHQMVRSLSPQFHATRNPVVPESSEVLLGALPDGKAGDAVELYLQRPDGVPTIELRTLASLTQKRSQATSPESSLEPSLEPLMIPLPGASAVGSYSVHAKSDSRLLGGVYVELAAAESDLVQYQMQQTPEAQGAGRPSNEAQAGDAPIQVTQAQQTPSMPPVSSGVVSSAVWRDDMNAIRENGVVLWPYLLMLGALLVAADSLWCGVGSASRFDHKQAEQKQGAANG